MNKITKDEALSTERALKLALESLKELVADPECDFGPSYELQEKRQKKAITAIREALAEQPAPPPECKTDAEKTAFAFGWWKALEENRKQPAQQPPTPEDLAKLGWQSIECPFCGSSGAQAFPKPAPVAEPVGVVGWAANRPNSIVTVHWEDECPPVGTKLYTSPQQQSTECVEPVAIVDAGDDGYWAEILPDRNVKVGQLLYTSPPIEATPLANANAGQRSVKPWVHATTWRGLTDEELREALRQCPHDTVENLRVRWLYAKDFARAIEAKLREKNEHREKNA